MITRFPSRDAIPSAELKVPRRAPFAFVRREGSALLRWRFAPSRAHEIFYPEKAAEHRDPRPRYESHGSILAISLATMDAYRPKETAGTSLGIKTIDTNQLKFVLFA